MRLQDARHPRELSDRNKTEITAVEPVWVMGSDIGHAGRHDAAPHHVREPVAFMVAGHARSEQVAVAEIAPVKGTRIEPRGYLDLGEPVTGYAREKALDQMFASSLKKIWIDDDAFRLVSRALRESHADERRERDESVARLRGEADRLQNRLDQLYIDKIDGRVTDEFHDRVAAGWRDERDRCFRDMESLNCAEDNPIDDGLALLDFVRTAHQGFQNQPLANKRRALNLVLSNRSYANGGLKINYREPFTILVKDDDPDPDPEGPESGSKPQAVEMAPRVGFEPTTDRLTVDCSTAELPRNTPPTRTRRPLCRQPTTLSRGFCGLL